MKWLLISGLLLAGPLCAELPVNEIPKYGNEPDYEPIWDRTPAEERPFNIENSNDAASKGWAYLQRGDVSTAIKRFNQAWTLYPKNYKALWGMAIVLFERSRELEGKALENQLGSAIALLDEAVDINPKDASLLTDSALLYATRGGLRKSLDDNGDASDFHKSESLLEQAEKTGGPHPQIYRTWAALRRYEGNEKAAKVFDEKAASLPGRKSD